MNPTRLKILCVVGTRPEAIKMAPVIRALLKTGRVETKVCVTAQHREMLDPLLKMFAITPDDDLQIMEENQTPSGVAAAVLSKIAPVLSREKPDWVLVQGDTTTVMATAIAAFYQRIKIGHIEAGLRTYDRTQPFPEEINRQLAGVLADAHFAPTEKARLNLLKEGRRSADVLVTGNTVIDALFWTAKLKMPQSVEKILQQIRSKHQPDTKIILITAHRRENFGKPIRDICEAVLALTERYQASAHFVYPVHLNPNIRRPVFQQLHGNDHVTLLDPLNYDELVHLLKQVYLVMTDSGGIQEEAPAFGKPVLVLREVTERPEAIEAGTAMLTGTDKNSIINNVCKLIDDPVRYREMANAVNPYGDGSASQRIVDFLLGNVVTPFEPTNQHE